MERTLFKIYCIKVYLIYSVMLVSGVQQTDLVIHIHTHIPVYLDVILDSGSRNPNPTCPEITLALPLQYIQHLAPSHHFCHYPNLAWTFVIDS